MFKLIKERLLNSKNAKIRLKMKKLQNNPRNYQTNNHTQNCSIQAQN